MTRSPPIPGSVEEMEPGIRRILAANPSPMTLHGTNTYLVGTDPVAVIDPGPADSSHLSAILAATGRAPVAAILVTHSHVDHSLLAGPLSKATGAPVLAYGDSFAGRSAWMQALADDGLLAGGEGVDAGFAPNRCVADGEEIDIGGPVLTALWTPGHFSNHLCFVLGDAVFTGDHVMGWASSLVSPPDGDLSAFMGSCRRLQDRADRIYYPGHGAPVTNPAARIRWLIEHRQAREAQIVAALRDGPQDAFEIAARVYRDTPAALRSAAARNVLAHLIALAGRNEAACDGLLSASARFYGR